MYLLLNNDSIDFSDSLGLEPWDRGNRITHDTDFGPNSDNPDSANRSRNLGDIVKKINEEKLRRGKACDCIAVLHLRTHGNATNVMLRGSNKGGQPGKHPTENANTSEPAQNTMMNHTNVASVGKYLKENVPFCKPCTIYISSCGGFACAKQQEHDVRRGEDTERTLGKALAEETGCTVKFSRGSTTSSSTDPHQSIMNKLAPGHPDYTQGGESGVGIYDTYSP